jgi:ABC-type multidrug transport system fused ATPase/permease subunit
MDLFDQMFVLDQGCLVEQGTRRELLDRQRLYASLYTQQSDDLLRLQANNLT